MARRNKILVPEAREALNQLKDKVMEDNGCNVNSPQSENVKYEVAIDLGIPLNKGYNGKLTSEQTGKIGGPIGGNMVKEMVKMAQEQFSKK